SHVISYPYFRRKIDIHAGPQNVVPDLIGLGIIVQYSHYNLGARLNAPREHAIQDRPTRVVPVDLGHEETPLSFNVHIEEYIRIQKEVGPVPAVGSEVYRVNRVVRFAQSLLT